MSASPSDVGAAVAAFVETTTDALASAGADDATVTAVATAGEAVVAAVDEHTAADAPAADAGERDEASRAPAGTPATTGAAARAEGSNSTSGDSDAADGPAGVASPTGPADPVESERIEALVADVAALETELSEAREQQARAAAEDRQRIHELEQQLADDATESTATGDATDGASAAPEPETPLEEIVALPASVAAESLSANQRRARAVAADIDQYSRSVPAGRALTAGALRRVLSAREDGGPTHTQTVTRVIEMLTTLGADAVTERNTHGGERVVVFSEALVARLAASGPDHTVVGDTQGGTAQRV